VLRNPWVVGLAIIAPLTALSMQVSIDSYGNTAFFGLMATGGLLSAVYGRWRNLAVSKAFLLGVVAALLSYALVLPLIVLTLAVFCTLGAIFDFSCF